MFIVMILLGLLLLLLLASYGIYRDSFYHVPGTEKDHSVLPQEDQKLLDQRREEMLGVSCERLSISAFDGIKLSARLFSAEEDAPVVIACHGYKGSADHSFACVFPIYRKLGFRILVIDHRAHGQSEGRTITLGVREHRDVASWVEYVQQRFGEKVPITLWGVSMGGASVLNAVPLCPRLSCIVSDCAFTDPAEITMYLIKGKCPFGSGLVFLLTRFSVRLWGGFSLKEASALEAVQKTKVPILFIHGEQDTFVPYEMGKRLFAACNSTKQFLSVPDAKHARSVVVQPALYEEKLTAFLTKNLNSAKTSLPKE